MRKFSLNKVVLKVKKFFEKNWLLLVILLLFLLFHAFFEAIITKELVEPLLSTLESNVFSDIIFLLLITFIVVRFICHIGKNYSISSRYILVSFFAFGAICYYRLSDYPWAFTSFSIAKGIKYIDVLALIFFSNIVIQLKCKTLSYQSKIESNKGFYFDNPILEGIGDKFSRDILARQIADKINNTANDQKSFVMGISGEWGQGKTSFMKLIENSLKVKDPEKIIINYNPWLNNDEKVVLNSFFKELRSKIQVYNKELSSNILKYSELLNAIGGDSISKLTKAFFSFKDESSVKGLFDDINASINRIGRQIIVFIDDLDRLHENEILEILKLIRNSASFANTIFIVAYDRNYLVSAINKINSYHPDAYMEKIFQIEIALPAYEKQIIKNELKKKLIPHLTEKDKKEFLEILEPTIFKYVLLDNYFGIGFLSSLRDVTRFCNSFVIAYEALEGESKLLDLLNLELLRMKYLGVYNLLSDKYNNFLQSYTLQSDKKFLSLAINKEKGSDGREIRKILIREYLLLNYLKVGVQYNEIDNVINYLYAIFPHYQHLHDIHLELLSIANPSSVARYFHYNLLQSDLSEIEFSKYRQKTSQEFHDGINDWIKKGSINQLRERFENIEFYSDKEDYEKVMRAIFYFASLTVPVFKDRIHERGFNEINLLDKLGVAKTKMYYTTEDDSFKNFIINLFEEPRESYLFITSFINKIFDTIKTPNWDFILDKESLNKLKITYFRRHAESISEIDRSFFVLFYICSDQQSFSKNEILSQSIRDEQKGEVASIFIENAERLSISFFTIIISIESRNYGEEDPRLYTIMKAVFHAWGTWGKFECFFYSLDEDESGILKEFKDFYSKFKDGGFEPATYNFKNISSPDIEFSA